MEIINNKKEKLIKMEEKDKFTQNYEQRKQYFLMPVREMKEFVANTFEVRHNVITDVYEFRRRPSDSSLGTVTKAQEADGDTWRPLDERGVVLHHKALGVFADTKSRTRHVDFESADGVHAAE